MKLPAMPVEVRVHPDAAHLVRQAGQIAERTQALQAGAIRLIGLGLFAVAVGMLFLGARLGALLRAERAVS